MGHFKSREASGVVLCPGQTDLPVVASDRKLNLRRDLHWVGKRTRKFPHKFNQVYQPPPPQKKISARPKCKHHAQFHVLNFSVTQLLLTQWAGWQMLKNFRRLSRKIE